jgi:hypothetical protein
LQVELQLRHFLVASEIVTETFPVASRIATQMFPVASGAATEVFPQLQVAVATENFSVTSEFVIEFVFCSCK